MLFLGRSMIVWVSLVVLVTILVFASGWRMAPPQNAIAGGIGAILIFLLHPTLQAGVQNSSLLDAVFVMLFVTTWRWTEDWSLFMRSWVLAGIYAFGLWVNSPFVLWGLVAMMPWVIFNRRPLPAVGGLLTVFLGGVLFFSVSWGLAWLLIPNLGRPLFTQWIRWGGIQMPPIISFPWLLLAISVVLERFTEMMQTRRSDASMFTAVLLVVTGLLGSPKLGLALIALSAPLIARSLVKREFLFHRGVRWLASVSFLLVLVMAYLLGREAWMITGLAIFIVGISSRWLYGNSRLPWNLAGEAVCVGAYIAESLGTFLHLFSS